MNLSSVARPATAHSIGYRPEIDGLRAIAVTLVLLVHGFPDQMPNGFIGVDIFFVISGFLITGILVTQLRAGSMSLREFYVRRINRIFPALALVLIACIGFGWISLYASEFTLLGRSIAAGAGFVANIDFFFQGGYWDIAADLKPLLHLWSLGVEEQFYLVWPVLLWLAWTLRLNLALVLGVIIAGSLAWNLWSIGIDQSATFYLPFSRFWELLAGGALAVASGRLQAPDSLNEPKFLDPLLAKFFRGHPDSVTRTVLANTSAVLGLVLIIAALLQRYPTQEYPGAHAIFPVLGAVLIILAGPRAWLNAKLLSHPWVVYVGLISYPLYLWHWPLLTFARILENGVLSPAFRNVAVLLAVLLSVGTYHFLERPIRTNRHRRGLTAVLLGAFVAVCGLSGYYIYARDGLVTRYANAASPIAASPLPKIAGLSKVALIGDSNALVLVPALQAIYAGKFHLFGTAGWPYLLGTEYKPGLLIAPGWTGTPKTTDDALEQIASDPSIDVVIISQMYVLYLEQDTLRSYPARPQETSSMAFEAGLRRTVKMLTDAGKHVVFVKTIPVLRDLPIVEACAPSVLPVRREVPAGCVVPLADVLNRRKDYDQLVGRALADLPRASVFNPLPYLCDASSCYVEKDGVLMYRDMWHLNPVGSQLMAVHVANFVQRQRNTAEASYQRE